MHEHDENYITVVDEQGNEELYRVLFTFESKEHHKSYVVVYPAGVSDDEEIALQAYSFTENERGDAGDLKPIETDEEWDMVEEVLEAFLDEEA